MLQHMVEVEVLQFVLGCVDLPIRVLEVGLDDKCRWITSLGGGRVIYKCSISGCLRVDLPVYYVPLQAYPHLVKTYGMSQY